MKAARATHERVQAPVLFPGGVADASQRAGFVADAGEIVAVDLAAGRPLWRAGVASQPLVVFGERLAAAALLADRSNALRIVVLDLARQGEPMLTSAPVVFTEWVSVANPDFFGCAAHVEGGRLLLDWEARAHYRGGAAPSAQVLRQSVKGAAGTAAVDLESGEVEQLLPEKAASVETAARRRALPPDPADLTAPWPIGARLARLVWELDDGEQTLSLETRDRSTGEAATLVELARGRGLGAQATPDGRFLLVDGTDERWEVFSAETGKRVATLSHERGAHSPAILRAVVYYLVETPQRTLTARDLDSDTLLWRLALAERREVQAPRLRQ